MKLTICALDEELEDSKKMSADNQSLVCLGSQLSKLKSIKQRPSLLAAYRFYAMYKAVMPKASPEAIYIEIGLIVGGLLEIIGIKDNNIISGTPNVITSTSSLRYVAKKSREATFMRISGFVCNYPCSTSCDKR